MTEKKELPLCRICLSDEGQADLVTPCECRGTIAFVHEACLNKWRTMQHATSRQDVCQLCMSPYRVRGDIRTSYYRAFVRVLSLASLVPLSLVAAEVMPRLPRRAQGVDVLGLDVLPWEKEAFGWLLDESTLTQISGVIERGGGAWESFIKTKRILPMLVLGLAKLGSFGVLLRFLFTNNVVGGRGAGQFDSVFIFSRLSPGQAVFVHYLLSCLSFRCVRTPQTKRDAILYTATCSLGLWFVNLVVEDWIRRLVLRIWPSLELARIASSNS